MDFRSNRPAAVKPTADLFEVGKRPRDEETEALIQEAFEEQEKQKQLKKGPTAPSGAKKAPSGKKTLAEIEDEEGGPVRESQVGMASTKRALSRKDQEAADVKGAGGDTEFGDVHAVQRAEEELEVEEEEGITFEPFNLRQEREEGDFDEEGNYVQKKDDARDAWLDSEEAAVASESVRRRVEQQQAALAAAEAARKDLSEGEIARMKLEMAGIMQAGETVTRALKRLGGEQASRKVMTKREKQRAQQEKQDMQVDGASGDSGSGNGGNGFMRLTELADTLLSSGELDIYSLRREILESEAALYAPRTALFQSAANGGANKDDDDDDDMFGDDDDKPKEANKQAPAERPSPSPTLNPTTTATTAAPAEAQAAGAAGAGSSGRADSDAATASSNGLPGSRAASSAAAGASNASAASEEPGVDYSSWPVKELRRFLTERGEDASSFVEKDDLVKRVRELAEAGPQGEMPPPPPGYVFDPGTGYYFSADTGLHYDTSSGAFYQSSTGKWFAWDDTSQQFVDWQSGSTT